MDQGEDSMTGLCVNACTRCPELVESRSQIVNGVGPNDAELVIVGEAPGADEDQYGEPFVGRSGEILTEKLAAVGIKRNRVRITNCVRCRPPDNRNPRASERSHCSEWLERELDEIDPALILAVGKVPAEHLLGRQISVTAEAGSIERVKIGNDLRRIAISVHPAAMLYNRSQESTLERTLTLVAKELGITPPADDQKRLGDF